MCVPSNEFDTILQNRYISEMIKNRFSLCKNLAPKKLINHKFKSYEKIKFALNYPSPLQLLVSLVEH